MNSTAHALTNSQPMPSPKGWTPSTSKSFSIGHGDNQPPRNMIEQSAATRIMFMYSARKKSANAMPEYSTWKPATISDSPSATSKGARLVSATPEMKYTTNSGNNHVQFQDPKPPACISMILPRFMVRVAINTPTSAKPIAIS